MSKLCHYLRHIDLLTVYEQLQDGEQYWYDGAPSANIQPQFRDTLAACFQEAADAVASLFVRPWEEVPPIDLASEVGDFVESSIQKLDGGTGEFLPHTDDSTRDTLNKFHSLALTDAYLAADEDQLYGLLIYQYDFLCWLYDTKAFSEAFEMCELIAETRCQLDHDWTISYGQARAERVATERAKKLAEKRHKPTNEIKANLLAEWDKDSHEYKSRADFCSVAGRLLGVKERTCGEWIAKHEKIK